MAVACRQIRQDQDIWGRAQLTLVALAISTYLIAFDFQQVLNDLLVLRSLGRSRTSRHDSW